MKLVTEAYELTQEFEELILKNYDVKVIDKTNEPWSVEFEGPKTGLIKMLEVHWSMEPREAQEYVEAQL